MLNYSILSTSAAVPSPNSCHYDELAKAENEKWSAERAVWEQERQERLEQFNIDFAKAMEEAANMRERLELMDKKLSPVNVP